MRPDGPIRVHVTGGSGFLGGFVIPLLLESGHTVSALARSPEAAQRLRALGAEPIDGDLESPASVRAAFAASGSSVLVNIASLGFGHAPTIVEAATGAGLRRAVFVSTTGIFTKLNAPSKTVRIAAEKSIRDSSLDWTIVRPTMIYGTPGDRNMWRLLRLIRRSPVMPMPGGGQNLQQPVHVADLASAVVATVGADIAIGKAYDVGGPDALSFREIVAQAGAAVGRTPRPIPVPARSLVRLLTLIERTGRSLPIKAEQIERLVEDKAFDITDAAADLGFAPRSFAEGIRSEAQMSTP